MVRQSISGGTATLLEVHELTRVYGSGSAAVHALRGIDLSVAAGEFVALMGPSGSGKSTLLNILGCLDRPTSGTYRFRGVELGRLDADRRALFRRRYLGFVFQGFHLLPRTPAIDNVELPLVYLGYGPLRRRSLARRALVEVGLGERLHHRPSELSGGQQQRVAIARALVTEPQLLLADEPTGSLDTGRGHEIMRLLCTLRSARRLTIVMVTHESDIAAYADRVVQFHDGCLAGEGAGEVAE